MSKIKKRRILNDIQCRNREMSIHFNLLGGKERERERERREGREVYLNTCLLLLSPFFFSSLTMYILNLPTEIQFIIIYYIKQDNLLDLAPLAQ